MVKLFTSERLPSFSPAIDPALLPADREVTVFPGFCDVHVHFREPGFSYKETISTGSKAAAHGGYTAVCTMPNLDPVPDCPEHMNIQREIIARDSVVSIYPYASITKGERGDELVDFQALAGTAIAFSDDGRGIQSGEMMEEAMKKAAALGKMIVAHCEVNELLRGGYIHAGDYAAVHGHRGIVSESEWKQIERDLAFAKKTGCAYHVCHISAKESVALIRKAKKDGVNVTCETAPHYLLLDETDLREEGRFKMNPPLRSKEDRRALIEGLLDGTIDMIATDHAPHSPEEKAKGLEKSAFGIVGIESAFPLLYTYLVLGGILPLEKLIELLAIRPRERFGIPLCAEDYTAWALDEKDSVNPAAFLSKGKATPFEHWNVNGRCLLTVANGRIAYRETH